MGTWQQDQKRIAEVGEIFDVNARQLQMEILQDDGLHRHVRFAKPGTGLYRFSLVTWPGYLAISGDVESFTFSRLPDMFEFFGGDRAHINPSYWAEKCVAGRDQLSAYDEKHARQLVIESFVDSARHGGVPRGTGRAVRDYILTDEDFAHEEGAHRLLRDFQHGDEYVAQCNARQDGKRCGWRCETGIYAEAAVKAREHEKTHPAGVIPVIKQPAFEFHDTWEWDLTSWSHHFLYACHAITWGIGRYYARKTMPPRLWAKHGRS